MPCSDIWQKLVLYKKGWKRKQIKSPDDKNNTNTDRVSINNIVTKLRTNFDFTHNLHSH